MCLLENKEGTWTKEKLARRLGKLKKYAIQLFLCQKVYLALAKKREKLAKKKEKIKNVLNVSTSSLVTAAEKSSQRAHSPPFAEKHNLCSVSCSRCAVLASVH